MAQMTKAALVKELESAQAILLKLSTENELLRKVNGELLEALKAPKVLVPSDFGSTSSGSGFAGVAARALAAADTDADDEPPFTPPKPARPEPEWLVHLPNMHQKSDEEAA